MRPATLAPVKSALVRVAPRRLAARRSAWIAFTAPSVDSSKLACVSTALRRSAPVRLAELTCAKDMRAPDRFAPVRLAPSRLARERFAPARLARSSFAPSRSAFSRLASWRIGAGEVGLAQVGVLEGGLSQHRRLEVGPFEIGARQRRARHRRVGEVEAAKVGALELLVLAQLLQNLVACQLTHVGRVLLYFRTPRRRRPLPGLRSGSVGADRAAWLIIRLSSSSFLAKASFSRRSARSTSPSRAS